MGLWATLQYPLKLIGWDSWTECGRLDKFSGNVLFPVRFPYLPGVDTGESSNESPSRPPPELHKNTQSDPLEEVSNFLCYCRL